MGQQYNGNILSLEELEHHKERIRDRYHRSLLEHFKIEPRRSNRGILSLGGEIEFKFTKGGKLSPDFESIKAIVGEDISPEILQCDGEVKNSAHNLITPSTSLDQAVDIIHDLFEPVYKAARQLGSDITLFSGHPAFTEEISQSMLSKGLRYRTLAEMMSPLARPAVISYADGHNEIIRGLNWEGFGSSQQTTIKVEHHMAGFYYDAANIMGPLFMAVSAASPFVDRKATNYNSTRNIILPPASYGFSEEEFKSGRPGRWRAFNPLTIKSTPAFFDHELYQKLVAANVELPIAKYFAQLSPDGHLLVTEEDLFGEQKDFPKATSWPWVQLQTGRFDEKYKIMDDYGIGLETRFGETMTTPEEIASYYLTWAAALEGLAQEVAQKNIYALPAEQVEENIRICSDKRSNKYKEVYWPNRNGSPRKKLADCFYQIGTFAVDNLRRHGHEESEIKDIVNPILTKAGIIYRGNNQLQYLSKPEPTPAEQMRAIAFKHQPGAYLGKELHQETISAIEEQFHYKGRSYDKFLAPVSERKSEYQSSCAE